MESPACYICPMTMQFPEKIPVPRSSPLRRIRIRFYPDDAPSRRKLHQPGEDGLFATTTPRSIVVPGFIIQGGDPVEQDAGSFAARHRWSRYFLNPETNDRPHKRGAISMAKMPRDGNSTRDFNDNGSQFFISLQDNGGATQFSAKSSGASKSSI